MKRSFFNALMAAIAITASCQVAAGNIGETDARRTAISFIQQRAATGAFRAAKAVNLTLAHAEASATVANANDYYAFNIDGGGWVIVAGEDRAVNVLGYNDQGHLDFNCLPCNFKALLDGYKREMEFLHTHPTIEVVAPEATSGDAGVEPLIRTTWGQEAPYNLQCPVYQKEYCVVGCVATAMAQVMKYWQYPQSCGSVSSYYCEDIGKTLDTLPPATFDYRLMIDSYCHWDWDNSELVQDSYTDAQAQEVAKLSRYCGQAVKMGYSPEGSGALVDDQLDAMIAFGYRSTAQDVLRDYYGYNIYSNKEWAGMMKAELNAKRPILYSAVDWDAGGHAFICDGYNSDGMFHFNMGWYGTCDGWYVISALNMTHRDGDELHFNYMHEMLLGIEPPEGWTPPTNLVTGDLDGNGDVDVVDLNLLIGLILEYDMTLADGAEPDLNGDGIIDIIDASLLINIILEKE